MVIQNTYSNLSNIVHTDFELGRVIQTVTAADPGITGQIHYSEHEAKRILSRLERADNIFYKLVGGS